MFLTICGHKEVQRNVGLRFGQTQETVNHKFFEVLRATDLLACDYIKTPTTQELRGVVRYHLSQFESGPPPRNKQELFNRYYAFLYYIIERTFRVWKKK
ncbi:hypothetical protein N665_2019s0004 [Sinapis alba]|nr:hypothetical protein N665_2019s0004 [Sinapis alba]